MATVSSRSDSSTHTHETEIDPFQQFVNDANVEMNEVEMADAKRIFDDATFRPGNLIIPKLVWLRYVIANKLHRDEFSSGSKRVEKDVIAERKKRREEYSSQFGFGIEYWEKYRKKGKFQADYLKDNYSPDQYLFFVKGRQIAEHLFADVADDDIPSAVHSLSRLHLDESYVAPRHDSSAVPDVDPRNDKSNHEMYDFDPVDSFQRPNDPSNSGSQESSSLSSSTSSASLCLPENLETREYLEALLEEKKAEEEYQKKKQNRLALELAVLDKKLDELNEQS